MFHQLKEILLISSVIRWVKVYKVFRDLEHKVLQVNLLDKVSKVLLVNLLDKVFKVHRVFKVCRVFRELKVSKVFRVFKAQWVSFRSLLQRQL
ncbi:MAG: hypothetical protein EBS89_01995 [Proteobacteria bacterium]|nr:hypothetical protein [Pseudomonadota bacterium]